MRGYKEDSLKTQVVLSVLTRGNGQKLKHGKFYLDIRNIAFL